MQSSRTKVLDTIRERIRLLGRRANDSTEQQLLNRISEAQAEWRLALRYFETMDDPELGEHAAYLLKAAERRYMFLLHEAKKRGLTYPRPEVLSPPGAAGGETQDQGR